MKVCFVWLIVLFSLAMASAASEPPSAEGQWLGTITGANLRVVFHITKNAEGKYSSTCDSPDQGVKGIPVASVTVSGETLQIDMSNIGGKYEGTFTADGQKIEGTWEQMGQSFPLILERTETLPEDVRPQLPKKPYPYVEEEITFDNADRSITFAGTLTKPTGDGPFPAVLLITGSGQQDRDETVFGHKTFLVLADYLTRRGLAILRVDDRGVGKSTGDPMQATTMDFTADALAAVAYLKHRSDIDPTRLGLLGHSEGALIADLATEQQSHDIAFLVFIGGPGVTGDEILYEQQRLIALAEGVPVEDVKQQTANSKRYYSIVKTEADNAIAAPRLKEAIRASFDRISEEQKKSLGITEEMIETQVRAISQQLLSPWFRFFLSYDPAPTIAKLKVPILAIWGEKDLQVPPAQNLPAVENALKQGGNTHYTVKVLPGLNHLLQTAKTGSPTEYTHIEETLSPSALQLIGDWIVEQTKK